MCHLNGALRADYDKKIMYWSTDETRFGLITDLGRRITLKGVKPKAKVQWNFEYRWLYGAVAPVQGEFFNWEFTHFNAHFFEVFLFKLPQEYPQHLHLIQMDGARAHTAKKLKVPSNIRLMLQPPYCPEVNVIERLWQELKKKLKGTIFEDIKGIQNEVTQWLENLLMALGPNL